MNKQEFQEFAQRARERNEAWKAAQRNAFKPTMPMDSTAFYAAKFKAESDATAHLRAQPIPNLNDIYSSSEHRQAHEEASRQRRIEVAASAHAWNGEGLQLPPQVVAEQKRHYFEQLNAQSAAEQQEIEQLRAQRGI
jgi:environmental stress-induced protein Ves